MKKEEFLKWVDANIPDNAEVRGITPSLVEIAYYEEPEIVKTDHEGKLIYVIW